MVTITPPAEQPNTVLVVDDDSDLRELLRLELESQGLSVVTANDGAEGVDRARTLEPDLILMDVMMPKMDGIEATRILKEDEHTRYTPILRITSSDSREDMVKGFAAGATDYITKPFFLPELKARVSATLRLKNIQNDLISVREQLIKEHMLKIIQETTSILQETVEHNFSIIFDKLETIIKNKKYLSQHDLDIIQDLANNIKSSVKNLDFLDSFTFKIYERISGITGKIE